jgi:hypothetical protein
MNKPIVSWLEVGELHNVSFEKRDECQWNKQQKKVPKKFV